MYDRRMFTAISALSAATLVHNPVLMCGAENSCESSGWPDPPKASIEDEMSPLVCDS